MKILLTLTILALYLSVKGQSKPKRFIDTCKMELDTIHHDRKGDFTVIGKDTVRNGLHQYRLIKKRVKN